MCKCGAGLPGAAPARRSRAVRRVGWKRGRRTQILFTPSVHYAAPVRVGSEAEHIELPFVLKAGSTVSLPLIGLECPTG
ncbi:hypothetical protein GCM10010279_32850 [Streptomyces mutabilis]|nr:hypothetical protein GCM10010279_32850 [Streptomyces mutabilis]